MRSDFVQVLKSSWQFRLPAGWTPFSSQLAAVQADRSLVSLPLPRLGRAVPPGATMALEDAGVHCTMTCSEARSWLRGIMPGRNAEGVLRLVFAQGSAVLLLPYEDNGLIWARPNILYLAPNLKIVKFTFMMPIWVGYTPRSPACREAPIPKEFQ